MTTLRKDAFVTKYNDAGAGLYKAGQVGGIGSDDHRSLVSDISDSVVWPEDELTIWKGRPTRLKTLAALPANTLSQVSGVDRLTKNSNGALPDIDGVSPQVGDSIIVSEEATSFHNGVYEVLIKGNSLTPWVLTRRSDSDTGQKITGAIYWVKEGTLNEGKYFKQTQYNDGSIANVFFEEFSLGGGSDQLEGVISSVQIQSSYSSPPMLASAGGSGTALVVESAIFSMDYNSAPYATNVKFELLVGSTSIFGEIAGLLDSTTDKVIMLTALSQDVEINQPIRFKAVDGNPTAGNSPIKFKIKFKTVTI